MGIELKFLAWAIVLGFVQLLVADLLVTRQRGLAWNTGPRDSSPPVSGVAGRSERAFRNFLETFPFFAAAVLAVTVAGRTGDHSALGVQLYFWARVVYVPLYMGAVRYLRSLAWVVAMAGLAMVLVPLLR
ncbi:MAPEG family protein [Pseudoxanthomonas sp. 10H]|uniref:MAPEG family protein n=1 Tax=Pseudoxanthomonas sp. 10H TaxID=3242729 RepID=UPI00355926BD